MEFKKPYVGICDVANTSESQWILEEYQKVRAVTCERLLKIGVVTSLNIIRGTPRQKGWEVPLLDRDQLGNVFIHSPELLNMIHFPDFAGESTVEDWLTAVTLCGPHVNAIQFDMTWPDPLAIDRFRAHMPGIQVALQVGTTAFGAIGENPQELFKKLREYGHGIDYVLLDKSMGKGLPLDALFLRPFVLEIVSHLHYLGVGVAGGIGPDTLDILELLSRYLPVLSTDSQAKLHIGDDKKLPMDWPKTARFLQKYHTYVRQQAQKMKKRIEDGRD